jgi:uncharacterized SAM-binding protein YcdF (DUF218 family)
MAFWKRKKNWEDQYDEYYAQDRRAEPAKKPGRLRFIPHLFLLAFLGALFVGGAGLVSGPTMVEKLLTALATPVGLVWLGLIVLVYFCMLNRQSWPALIGFGCWLVLTVGGNQLVANWLANSLEAPFQEIEIFDVEPFDTVVVLGGGTNSLRNGRSQLSSSGDRIATAARLFHAGQVKRLVCTGTQTFRSNPKDLHPREEAAGILIGLGVPREFVLQMKGENTSQEMANLKAWIDQHDSDGRVGILTSAWHLPRAMRLAESQGLEVHPIPSNFASGPFRPSPDLVVPSGQNLMVTGQMMKEYLARIVAR